MEAVTRSTKATERSLAVLALGAVLAFLWLARELLLPTVLALFVAFSVHPAVAWLERRKVPRSLAALAGTVLAVLIVTGIFALLYNRVAAFFEDLPTYEERIRIAYHEVAAHFTRIQRQSGQLVTPQPVPWGGLLVGTAQGALALAAEAAVAVFALYFALAEGPRYREKFLDAVRHDSIARDRALAAVREIQRDLEQYVLNRLLLNGALGVVVAGVYALYGLEHAVIWGLTTALLHFIPYVGPAVGVALPALMAFLQYGRLGNVLVVSAIYVALVSLQGNVVDPLFLGKQLRLSSIVVFLGSLFWFWIWGPVGLFLAVPLLSSIRIACSHIPRLRMVADFLGE